MPFPNEHAARLQNPDSLTPLLRVRRTSGSDSGTVQGKTVPESIDVIWYIIRRDGREVPVPQALRFPTSTWSVSEARAWLSDNDIDVVLFEPAGESASMTVFSPDSPMVAVGPEEEADEIITQRFSKELFRAGGYEYQDGSGFNVESDRLQLMHSETARLLENGTRIPLSDGPIPHEDVANPHYGIGDLEFVSVEGQSIFGIIKIVGKKNIENALANDVSIFSEPEYKDSKGEIYVTPITHVAVTPNPLVGGLSDWVKIAASLKKDGKRSTFKGGLVMWKKIAKALGLSDDAVEKITPENAEDKITAAIKDLKSKHEEALKEAKKASVKAALESEDNKETVDEFVKERVDTEVAEIKASLGGGERKVDPMTLGLIVDNRKMKLDALVSAGRLTPAARKKVDERFGAKDVIAASMKKGENGESFDFLAEILLANDPLVLAEQTGAQVIKASLVDPNKGGTKDEDNPLLKDAGRRAEAVAK